MTAAILVVLSVNTALVLQLASKQWRSRHFSKQFWQAFHAFEERNPYPPNPKADS